MIYSAFFLNYETPIRIVDTVYPSLPEGMDDPYDYSHINHARFLEPLWESKSWSHCQAFRTAAYPTWYCPEAIILKGEGKLPELMPNGRVIVSQRVRKVIEQVDDFEHQFHPIKLLNREGHNLADQPYFFMSVRRQIEVEQLNLPYELRSWTIRRSVTGAIATIRYFAATRQCLERLPIWRVHDDGAVFINDELLNALKEAGINDWSLSVGGDDPEPSGLTLSEVYNQKDVDTAR